MSDNKQLIDQIETAMDQLIDVASHIQKLVSHLSDDESIRSFVENYNEMSTRLREMEKTIHRLGLDRTTPQFARVDAKLRAFEARNQEFLKKIAK